MTTIKLTDAAHIEGGEGMFLRYRDENGKAMAGGIVGAYYTAPAKDDNGNRYDVYWELRGDFDIENEDEDNACDWDHPYMILDDAGRDVEEKVTIRW